MSILKEKYREDLIELKEKLEMAVQILRLYASDDQWVYSEDNISAFDYKGIYAKQVLERIEGDSNEKIGIR